MFINVVLPAPFSPRRPMISPRRSSILTVSLARREPKRLVISLSRRTISGSAALARGSAGLRLFVVDLDNKRPAFDFFLACLDLGLHIGWHLILEGAKRREAAAAVLHEGVNAVILSGE